MIDKPDKFARPLPETPRTDPRPTRHFAAVRNIPQWLPHMFMSLLFTRTAVMLWLLSQHNRRAAKGHSNDPLSWENRRMALLTKRYIMQVHGKPKFASHDSDLTPAQRRWVVSGVLSVLSFMLGGLAYKVLRVMPHLVGGNEFFANAMVVGRIPLLIAAGAVVVLRQRALHNAIWVATLTLGLGLIMMGFGYFEAYGS